MLSDDRLRSPALFEKIATPEQAAALIEDGMNVGVGGFTPSGYPKKTTMALAKAIKNGKKCRINIWSGASVGPEIEEDLAAVDGVKSRMPYYAASNKSMRAGINGGKIDYIDLHLSHFAQQVDYGFFGDVDVAIVEAAAINADGSIVLGPGVGNIPMFVKHAKKGGSQHHHSAFHGGHARYLYLRKAALPQGDTYLPCRRPHRFAVYGVRAG